MSATNVINSLFLIIALISTLAQYLQRYFTISVRFLLIRLNKHDYIVGIPVCFLDLWTRRDCLVIAGKHSGSRDIRRRRGGS